MWTLMGIYRENTNQCRVSIKEKDCMLKEKTPINIYLFHELFSP